MIKMSSHDLATEFISLQDFCGRNNRRVDAFNITGELTTTATEKMAAIISKTVACGGVKKLNLNRLDIIFLLHCAAMANNVRTLQHLLDTESSQVGVEDRAGSQGLTLLHQAAMYNSVSVIRELLHRGAKVDSRDSNKRTPLSWAAEYVSLDAARLLVSNKAAINSHDYACGTPLAYLHYISSTGDVGTTAYLRNQEMEKLLLENGGKLHKWRAWLYRWFVL